MYFKLRGALISVPIKAIEYFLTPAQKESFNLYALYSKNKPQSDSLLLHHGNDFFKVREHLGWVGQTQIYTLRSISIWKAVQFILFWLCTPAGRVSGPWV